MDNKNETMRIKPEYRMRRSIPLKVFAHTVMFFSFCCFLVALFYLILFWRTYYDGSKSFAESTKNDYFNTSLFTADYSDRMSNLISFLNTVQEHNGFDDVQEMEYWRKIYFNRSVNFQYAIFDNAGQLIVKSDEFDEAGSADAAGYTANGRIFYYAIDLAGLSLYESASIDDAMRNYGDVSDIGSNFMADEWYYFSEDGNVPDNIGYIYTYVPEQLAAGDIFFSHAQTVAGYDQKMVIAGLLASLTVFFVCLIYTLLAAGWKYGSEDIKLFFIDKVFTEILLFALFMLVPGWVSASMMLIGFALTGPGAAELAGLILLVASAYMAVMICLYSLARRLKAHNLLTGSLIYKFFFTIYRVVYQGMINHHLLRKYVWLVLSLGVLDLMLMAIFMSTYSLLTQLFIVFIYGFELIYIGRKMMALSAIAAGAKEISGGNLDYKIDTTHMGSGVFSEFADNINNIGQGLNRAVDKSIKSERMKADLITNVSHDIKTPLTSIINYVDLLKRQNITQEPSREYIEILDSKSQRLKMLIEDLVEASRASSGNITLERTTIDFYELAQQIAGSYVEKYEQRQLSLVMNQPEEPLLIFADGRRMYRVLDNLFNNAFKYAMSGSRIYIDLFAGRDSVCFVMKNISQAPLNITAEELTQRFVRGDKSRTTEGSGLGLSIAESLVTLHGGEFKILLDGDLFKAMIRMKRVYLVPQSEDAQKEDATPQ